MEYSVTKLDEENEPVVFANNVLRNYYLDAFLGNFNAQEYPFQIDSVTYQVQNFHRQTHLDV